VGRPRLREPGLDLFGRRHVDLAEDAADLPGEGVALFLVEVEDRDLHAVRGQHARGGGAEAGRAARDDRGHCLVELHER